LKPMTFGYKALSVRQPFAELLVTGLKPVENRTWDTDHRGPLAIHAAQTFTAEEARQAAMLADSGVPLPTEFPTACILGIVRLVDVIHVDETPDSKSEWMTYLRRIGYQFGDREVGGVVDSIIDHLEGDYCWIIDTPRKFTELQYLQGRLGLFTASVEL
jgi:hypothetical protein